MKNEVRMAVGLPSDLENELFNLNDEANELLEEGKLEESLEKIKMAWEKLPQPKFNTSCSRMILIDLIPVLNKSGKHDEALQLVKDWIIEEESSGYKIYDTMPYILHGETLLYLNQVEATKNAFYQAVKYGATKRDFSDHPDFYFELAQKKLNDHKEILELFHKEVLSQPGLSIRPEFTELSEELAERIQVLRERGEDLFDDGKFRKAIRIWTEALALVPEPRNLYEETFLLEMSLGDGYYMLNNFRRSLVHLYNAKGNIETNAYEDPFLMLRIGQVFFELEQDKEAKEFLIRAYVLEGPDIFSGEEDKYFKFMNAHLSIN